MIKSTCIILVLSTKTLLGMNLSWPTDDNSFFKGASIESIIQPAASGTLESGLFGYARNSGKKFHEGIDIKPKKRDRKGEATDKVLAAMDGRIVHINTIAGNSNYGKYIVMVHPNVQPSVYTLYAHLSSVDLLLRVGKVVRAGETIGIMGRSSSGTPIPKERAHLHFEMGFMLSDNFKKWYDLQKYGNPNKHGIWNGFNLTGFDPLDFYIGWRDGKIASIDDYMKGLPVAFSLRVLNKKVPNFVQRYPTLVTKRIEPKSLKGWDIDFTWYALPFRWTPIYDGDLDGKTSTPSLIAYNAVVFEQSNCKDTIVVKVGKVPVHGKVLKKTISLLFEH